ncbi:MAG: DMT family transporter [Thermodesulfobacteriota bacterium]
MPKSSGNNNLLLGAGCMVLAAFFFAMVGVFVKLAGQTVGVWQISFYRALFGILSMLGLAGCLRVAILGPNLKLLIVRGLSGTVGFLCLIMAMRDVPLAEVMVLFFLFPAFGALFAPWVNDERVAPRDWLFISLAFAGTAAILLPGGDMHLRPGHFYALGTSVLAGLNTAMVRRLAGEHSPYCIYFFFCLAAAVVSIWPLALGSEPLIPSAAGLMYLLAIGLVATVGQVLMNQGFYHLPAAEGGVVLMSQVIIAAAWGVLFFGEPLTWRLILGGGLILAGGSGLSRRAKAKVLQ